MKLGNINDTDNKCKQKSSGNSINIKRTRVKQQTKVKKINLQKLAQQFKRSFKFEAKCQPEISDMQMKWQTNTRNSQLKDMQMADKLVKKIDAKTVTVIVFK